jgi:hypothetical protein
MIVKYLLMLIPIGFAIYVFIRINNRGKQINQLYKDIDDLVKSIKDIWEK